MSEEDLFSVLPLELQVYIADAVGERCDRAALALASPRLLGLAACRELPSYQGLEMSLAFHVVLGGAIDEQVLRRYASRAEATLEGCGWLTGVAAGLRTAYRLTGSGPGLGSGPGSVREAEQRWYLMQPDSTFGTLLRIETKVPPATVHYEGAEGAEGMVRCDLASGRVLHYEGDKEMERLVRSEQRSGAVLHYEGEKEMERMVRFELPSGVVLHYEGDTGMERLGRSKEPSGAVLHYEGEKEMERVVRSEQPSLPGRIGHVLHFEGEMNTERLVRSEGPGVVIYYEGEKSVERMVRCDHKWGVVGHYAGEGGTERLVRVGLPFGVSISIQGEPGRERPKVTFANLIVFALICFIVYVLATPASRFCRALFTSV